MATPAAIQAQLDATGLAAVIRTSAHADATYDNHYVVGGIGYAGRALWCQTTAAQTASQQATDIATQLAAFR